MWSRAGTGWPSCCATARACTRPAALADGRPGGMTDPAHARALAVAGAEIWLARPSPAGQCRQGRCRQGRGREDTCYKNTWRTDAERQGMS
jgi:hypothetical protein